MRAVAIRTEHSSKADCIKAVGHASHTNCLIWIPRSSTFETAITGFPETTTTTNQPHPDNISLKPNNRPFHPPTSSPIQPSMLPSRFLSTTLASAIVSAQQPAQSFRCPKSDIIKTLCLGPRDYLYANPNSCSSYVQCVVNVGGGSDVAFIYECPRGLQWNDRNIGGFGCVLVDVLRSMHVVL